MPCRRFFRTPSGFEIAITRQLTLELARQAARLTLHDLERRPLGETAQQRIVGQAVLVAVYFSTTNTTRRLRLRFSRLSFGTTGSLSP